MDLETDGLEIIEPGKALAIPGVITATSLILPEDLTFERWLTIGETLAQMGKSIQWWQGDWWAFGGRQWGDKAWQAVDGYKDPENYVEIMGWVARQFRDPQGPILDSNLELPMRRENLSWTHHRIVAGLEPDKVDELLDEAIDNNWTVRELRQEVRWAKYVEGRTPQGGQGDVSPLSQVPRKYDLIYADPPWQYDFVETEARAIENQYPTMAVEEICNLPVADIAADKCVLLLWATAPKLSEAMRVMAVWGFTFRTCMVWVKDRVGMGYYVRNQHELLLIGKRGDVPVPREADRPSSVIHAPRAEHSKKPTEFYLVIETMYPDLNKIELFARAARPGWAVWGLEVNSGSTTA